MGKKKENIKWNHIACSKEQNKVLQNRLLNTLHQLTYNLLNRYYLLDFNVKQKRLNELMEKIEMLRDVIEEEKHL